MSTNAPGASGEICGDVGGGVGDEEPAPTPPTSARIALSCVLHFGFPHHISSKEKFPLVCFFF